MFLFALPEHSRMSQNVAVQNRSTEKHQSAQLTWIAYLQGNRSPSDRLSTWAREDRRGSGIGLYLQSFQTP
jgi:hypothetical protein